MTAPPDTAIVSARAAELALVAPLPRADKNPYHVYMASLAAQSRESARYVLGLVLAALEIDVAPEAFPWWQLRYAHMQFARSQLAASHAAATANKAINTTRAVLREARRLRLYSPDDLADVEAVKPVKSTRLPPGRALDPGEVQSLRGVCEPKAIGARDMAMLMILFGCGLRRREATSLNLASFDATAGTLQFLGKGNKERVVPVPRPARVAIDAWLRVRGAGEPKDPLLSPVSRGGRVLAPRRLSPETVRRVMMKLATRAGVKRFTPHDARRTLISELLDRGADIASVADLVGHESIETTRDYDRRGERAKRAASDLLEGMFADTK